MSLLDSVNTLKEYLDKETQSASKSLKASNLRAASDPSNATASVVSTQSSGSALDSLKTNPIISAGIDSVNQYVTTTTQSLVKGALDSATAKIAAPIQAATQAFFTAFAQITTLSTEVGMEIARNTARNLVKEIAKKDAAAAALKVQVTALYNACAILLNGQPFFQDYLKKIIQAYTLIKGARVKLATVVKVLTASNKYQKYNFTSAMTDLTAAQALLLPDRGANVTSINAAGELLNSVLGRQSNKQVVAAALAIPGITLQIGKGIVEYALLCISVNGLINTYCNALNDLIAGYKQSSIINDVTINHLTSGITQIDALIAEMDGVLGNYTAAQTTNTTYTTKVTSYATGWAVKLTAIVEWLKLNPGAGSQVLSQTSESVTRYLKGVAAIKALTTKSFVGGQLTLIEGQEQPVPASKYVTNLIVAANTIVATSQSKSDVRALAKTVQNYLDASIINDAAIVAAVTPFINTPSNIISPADKLVSNLIGFANKLGLDRAVGLLSSGNIKDLFAMTPSTATYSGAAVVALNDIIAKVKASPNATDQQTGRLESLRDEVDRDKKTKEIEASRSSTATSDADDEQIKAKVLRTKSIATQGVASAQEIDDSSDTTTDDVTVTKNVTAVVPGMAATNSTPSVAGVDQTSITNIASGGLPKL